MPLVGLAGLFTLYIFVGTIFEGRELAQERGDDYRAYQKRAPKFIPKLGK